LESSGKNDVVRSKVVASVICPMNWKSHFKSGGEQNVVRSKVAAPVVTCKTIWRAVVTKCCKIKGRGTCYSSDILKSDCKKNVVRSKVRAPVSCHINCKSF